MAGDEGTIVEVLVEIPKGSRNKYEFDRERGAMRLDRRLFSATTYPADYGFIPETLAGDGDALDALVLLDDPTFPGCLIRARPLGVFFMEDEKGPDAKIICVVHDDPLWSDVKDIEELPSPLRQEIHHFFDVYKVLEPNKNASTIGYKGLPAALDEIEEARRRWRSRGEGA
ncbi:MAG TPA: inorganic diphosphatase [Actinomycetota bacterium]|nr:inorganic diphosphatase [Actinomycetota bacterium]